MKKTIQWLLLPAAVIMSLSVTAQTADEVINKYIDAIGGKEKLKQITSLSMEGSVQVMGNENPTTVTILNGKGYKSESQFNGQKMIQCYTDKGGWTVNPMNGGNAEAMPEDMYNSGKDQIDIGGALLDYAAKGSTVTLQGKEGNAYKLVLTTKDKVSTTYLVDANTYYITAVMKKGNMMGQPIDITINLSDYKKADNGIALPYTINTDLGGQFALTTTIKKVDVNKPVDAAAFAMPK
ncbi:MAG TPA: hypothetical protein VL307_04060 [Chitinophagaceae bacterium]|nr:hypothetical protein [Chitinophagaceae bacterium]